MIYTSLPVCFLVLGAALCAPESIQNEHEALEAGHTFHNGDHRDQPWNNDWYDVGLGKRAYSYVSEYKRLPVYNFGLGKRSRPYAPLYSFGLGKRSVEDSQPDEEISNDIDQETLAELFDQYGNTPGYEVKRARPYSFGLGKRFSEEPIQERAARIYEFGLGKRLPLYNFGLGKRARGYDFGLGKRLSSKFNFGLGKRERDMHRFNFGLGKRSADDSVNDGDNN